MSKKIKMIIAIISIILLCGCETIDSEDYHTASDTIWYFTNYVDKETCVEYFVSYSTYNYGSVSLRYNADGTPKINEKCLSKKEDR